MDRDLARNWMWSEACEMLARAERLHREFFTPAGLVARLPAWEPPVDILETEREVLVLVALPGVNPETVDAAVDGTDLVVVGTRVLPAELQTAVIHRLELPQGRFERRVRRQVEFVWLERVDEAVSSALEPQTQVNSAIPEE